MRKKKIPVPRIKKFREAVDNIENNRNATLIKALYLTASRCNELLTKQCPSDSKYTRPLGKYNRTEMLIKDIPYIKYPHKDKFIASLDNALDSDGNPERWLANTRPSNDQMDILLLRVPVSKKKGDRINDLEPRLKPIALVIDPYFESWTFDLLEWIKEHRDYDEENGSLYFDLVRQRVGVIVKKELGFHPHHLKHCRLTHLRNNYKLEGEEISVVAGWETETGFSFTGHRVSPMIGDYIDSLWTEYLPKLFVPMNEIIRDTRL